MLGLDITSQLIGGGHSYPSSLSKDKNGVLQIMDCSASKIPSLSITSHHLRPIGDPTAEGRGLTPSPEVQSAYCTAPTDRVDKILKLHLALLH